MLAVPALLVLPPSVLVVPAVLLVVPALLVLPPSALVVPALLLVVPAVLVVLPPSGITEVPAVFVESDPPLPPNVPQFSGKEG